MFSGRQTEMSHFLLQTGDMDTDDLCDEIELMLNPGERFVEEEEESSTHQTKNDTVKSPEPIKIEGKSSRNNRSKKKVFTAEEFQEKLSKVTSAMPIPEPTVSTSFNIRKRRIILGGTSQSAPMDSDQGTDEEYVHHDDFQSPGWQPPAKRKRSSGADQAVVSRSPKEKDEVCEVRHARIEFSPKTQANYLPYVVRDRWSLMERELLMMDSDNPLPVQLMPTGTKSELRDHLRTSFQFEQPQNFMRIWDVRQVKEDPRLADFLKEIESTRMVSVNAEGGRESPQVMITLGTSSGKAVFFHDGNLMPAKLKSILSDVKFVKIGSGLPAEFHSLERMGLRLRGWVDSGSVYRALLLQESCSGIEAQVEYLRNAGFVEEPFRYHRYEWENWDKSVKKGSIPDEMWPHIVQNVRVPMAVALAAALKFAEERGYPENKPMMPVIWEGLDLLRCKVPEDLKKLPVITHLNWMTGPLTSDFGEEHSQLNDAFVLLHLRQASADFVEVYELNFDPKKAASEAHQTVKQAYETLEMLPRTKWLKKYTAEELLDGRCLGCGKREKKRHEINECPKKPASGGWVCDYDHDGVTDLAPHSTIMCPVLHHLCTICKSRGHHERVHETRSHPLRELRERFFSFAPRGALTAVPFLALISSLLPKLTRSQWRLGYRGTNYRTDMIMRAFLRLETRVVFSAQSKKSFEEERKIWVRAFSAKIDRVRKNAEADDPSKIEPINRDIIAREILAITESETVTMDENEDKTGKRKPPTFVANKHSKKN